MSGLFCGWGLFGLVSQNRRFRKLSSMHYRASGELPWYPPGIECRMPDELREVFLRLSSMITIDF
jgi:hypothetical protein